MIRVLRLIEYTFENDEAAEQHFSLLSVPLNGGKKFGAVPGMHIRSCAMVDFNFKADDDGR